MSLPKTDERILLLHNPRCTKSRAALALLEARGAPVDVRRYLDEPLSAAELADLRKRLDRPAIEWVRRGEPEFKAAGSRPGLEGQRTCSPPIAAHPILLERPIAVRGARAALGRPPKGVLVLLDE